MLPADESAFRDYVTGCRRSLVRTAYLLTGSWGTAEGLVQDAMARLYVVWTKVRRREDPDLHAERILLSLYFDGLRKPWRSIAATSDATAVPDDRQAGTESAYRERLRLALLSIPPKQRAVLVLRYWAGHSPERTADLLNCSVNTVTKRTARAMQLLHDVLDKADTDTMGTAQ